MVVRLLRDPRDHLVVVQQHGQRGLLARLCQPGEDPVVRAAAAPQPHPAAVHRESGQQYDVRLQDGVRPQSCTVRLQQTPSRAHQMPVAPVHRPVEVVVRHQHREQDPYPPRAQCVEQHARARLAAHRDVGGDGTGTCQLRQVQCPPRQNLRGFARVSTGQQLSRREEFTPYSGLSGHVITHQDTANLS